MADETVRGRFMWHELATPDSERAHAFYSQALGWTTEGWEQDESYKMFVAPAGPLGGTIAAKDGGSHWLMYVGTPDIDASVAEATRLGASVQTPPTAIPNGSRYAVLKDPQGATFAVYSPADDPGPENRPSYGEFTWHELATTDNRAAFDFYSQLFGWSKLSEFDMGAMGTYLIFGRSNVQLGGIFNKGDMGMPGTYWVGYVRVKDVHDVVKNVKAANGSLVNGPMEVPGGDWIAQFFDPNGALFAVSQLAADVKPGAKKAAKLAAPKAPAKKKAAAKKKPAKKKSRAAAAGAERAARKAPSGAARPAKKGGKKTAKKKAATKKKRAAKAKARPAQKAATRKKKKKSGAKTSKRKARRRR